MKRLSLSLSLASFLYVPLAFAAYDAPSDLLKAVQADTSPRTVRMEAHVQADIENEPFFLSLWAKGRTQGDIDDKVAEMSLTLDIVGPASKTDVRVKGRMRIVDGMAYATIDDVTGNMGTDGLEFDAAMEQLRGRWVSSKADASATEAFGIDLSEMLDADLLRMERTQGKDGSSYSIMLDRKAILMLRDLLSMFDLGASPSVNFHTVVNVNVFDQIMNSRGYLSVQAGPFSVVFQYASELLDVPFAVRAPAGAVPFENEGPSYEEWLPEPSSNTNAKYEARAAARALRQQTVKKPVSSAKLPAGILSFGEESAPVTVTEYTDYECPFCRRFHMDTYSLLKKDYIDTGKVRFVIRQYPLTSIHKGALPAATAVQCALEQGNENGRNVSDAMWNLQETGNALTITNIKKYVMMFGSIDMQAFNDCFGGDAVQAVINAQMKEGEEAGVMGTPAFFLNNHAGATATISGAAPYATFQDQIDALLK